MRRYKYVIAINAQPSPKHAIATRFVDRMNTLSDNRDIVQKTAWLIRAFKTRYRAGLSWLGRFEESKTALRAVTTSSVLIVGWRLRTMPGILPEAGTGEENQRATFTWKLWSRRTGFLVSLRRQLYQWQAQLWSCLVEQRVDDEAFGVRRFVG